jgi:hypothetical protein
LTNFKGVAFFLIRIPPSSLLAESDWMTLVLRAGVVLAKPRPTIFGGIFFSESDDSTSSLDFLPHFEGVAFFLDRIPPSSLLAESDWMTLVLRAGVVLVKPRPTIFRGIFFPE